MPLALAQEQDGNIVIGDSVFVRSGPNDSYIPVGALYAGDKVFPLNISADGQWILIPYSNGYGWIRRDLVRWENEAQINALVPFPADFTPTPLQPRQRPTASNPTATPEGDYANPRGSQSVYVRAGPGRGYLRLGQILPGENIEAVSRNESGSWIMIRFSNSPGIEGFGWIGRNAAHWEDEDSLEELPIIATDELTPTLTLTPSNTPPATALPESTPEVIPEAVEATEDANLTPFEAVAATDTATSRPTDSPTETSTYTDVPTATDTLTATPTPTLTQTATDVPTSTETPVPTETDAPTSTETPVPTDTATLTATQTNTPIPTSTDTAIPTDTPTSTHTNTAIPTDTLTATHTETLVPTDTATLTATHTETPVPTDTATATNTLTATHTNTPIPTATDTAIPSETPTETPVVTDIFAVQATSVAVEATGVPTDPTDAPIEPQTVLPSDGEGTSGENPRLPIELIGGGIALFLVLIYIWFYAQGLGTAGRYSDGFVVSKCPVCERGSLHIDERKTRMLGIPTVRRTVRCDECRSVLRETGSRHWRYAVDRIENPVMYDRFNGEELTDDDIERLAKQPPKGVNPRTSPEFVDDGQDDT